MRLRNLPNMIDARGRQYMWFDIEDRCIPLIEEGEAPPDQDHYDAAERQTAFIHEHDKDDE